MAADSAVELFTSIPPYASRPINGREMGLAWQRACIQSWKANGFEVTSFNNPDEVSRLNSFNADIKFVTIPVDQRRPRISEIIKTAIASGRDIAGIINADCLIVPQAKLTEKLIGVNGVVIAERINLDKTLRPTGYPCMGFDAFFFDTKSLSKIHKDERWRLGDTWWDYWFPLAFQSAGLQSKTLPAPLLLHLEHVPMWDWAIWENGFPQLAEFVRSLSFT